MQVEIVQFPRTPVAAFEYRGPSEREHDASRTFIEWRIQNRLSPDKHRTYGIHYNMTDPRVTGTSHIDLCVSYDGDVAPNPQGVVSKVIPELRCARARHRGSRDFNSTAFELYTQWLPASGEAVGGFPWFFHYVNVGPNVQVNEMITDVYLPLR